MGSIPTRTKLHNNLGQVLRTKQYSLVLVEGQWSSLAGKVTAGLVKSNGSLLPKDDLKVTCGLTACTPKSAPGPTIGIEYGRNLLFLWVSSETIAINRINWPHQTVRHCYQPAAEQLRVYWYDIYVCWATFDMIRPATDPSTHHNNSMYTLH